MKHKLYIISTHLSLILGVAFLLLLSIEWLFPFLHFVESVPGHWLLLLLCLSTITSSISILHVRRQHKRHKQARDGMKEEQALHRI